MSPRVVVVITGASSGVGRAIARAFGAQRARVALIARGVDGLEATAREVRDAGGDALALPLDVSDVAAVDNAAEEVMQRWGFIDGWVNNAMVSVFSPVTRMRANEYRRVMEVNFLGYVHGTLAALRHIRPRNEGAMAFTGYGALAARLVKAGRAVLFAARAHARDTGCRARSPKGARMAGGEAASAKHRNPAPC